MEKTVLAGLDSTTYEHPFDRKALASLEKMPGVSLLFRKINEYGIDRLLRLQSLGSEFKVTPRNFPQLHQALLETCYILDVSPLPELYLFRGTGYIQTYTIGVENPIVGINLEAMEWLSIAELTFVLGHEVAHIKSRHLLYHQTAVVMPLLKNIVSSTTLGLGGLAANGIEIALYNWLIMAKFTCDRAGLLACQDIEVATGALMKLGGLPREYLTATVRADFLGQAREFASNNLANLDKLTKMLSFMEYKQPWAVMRAGELLKWVEVEDYAKLLRSHSELSRAPEPPLTETVTSETPFESGAIDPDAGLADDRSTVFSDANQPTDTEDWNFLKSW